MYKRYDRINHVKTIEWHKIFQKHTNFKSIWWTWTISKNSWSNLEDEFCRKMQHNIQNRIIGWKKLANSSLGIPASHFCCSDSWSIVYDHRLEGGEEFFNGCWNFILVFDATDATVYSSALKSCWRAAAKFQRMKFLLSVRHVYVPVFVPTKLEHFVKIFANFRRIRKHGWNVSSVAERIARIFK